MIALLATGAAMADTVPPSIVLIVLGSVAGVSIAGLFTSGFVVAMVLLAVLAVLARWKAAGEHGRRAPRAAQVIGRTLLVAAPALVLPFLIRSTVGGGVATATEVSTIAVIYALFIGHRPLRRHRLAQVLRHARRDGGAHRRDPADPRHGLGDGLGDHPGRRRPAARRLHDGLPGGWITFMAVTIVVFLMLGCVLEGLPAIVLMAPLMFPIAKNLGINDIHYSMVVVTAMNIGLMSPRSASASISPARSATSRRTRPWAPSGPTSWRCSSASC